jgi:APA family basic amino acid/polyamine antiporter
MMDLLENICFIDCNFTRKATPYGLWLSILMDLGAIAGLTTVALTVLLSQTRIFYAMAHDGLLPPFFAKIHRSTETPWISTIISGTFIFLFYV